MALISKLKFTQGILTDDAGVSLFVTAGVAVTLSNDDNTDVNQWEFSILDAPPTSAATIGVKQAFSTTPTYTFTPDVLGGMWFFQLRVKNVTTGEIRSSVVQYSDQPDSGTGCCVGTYDINGNVKVAVGTTRRHLNFDGNERGSATYIEPFLDYVGLVPGDVITGTILHSEGAAVGDILTTSATPDVYQRATAANLSTTRKPDGMIIIITPGVTYDTITIARSGIWDASITGLAAADAGYVRLNTATARLIRDSDIADDEWLMGWADGVPQFSLVVPARKGLGGGTANYSPAAGTEALGTASGLHTYDTSGGTVQTFTLPVGAAEATNHELRAKGYPEGTVVVTPPAGGQIDGSGVNVSKTFRALSAGFALMCLGANLWESRIVPGSDMVLNARDFGHVGNGVADDSAAIDRMLATPKRLNYNTQAGITFHIPPTPGGTMVNTTIRGFRYDATGGYVGNVRLIGGTITSAVQATTLMYIAIPTRKGGAGVSVTAITIGATSGYTYARLGGFPANTFPVLHTVGQDIQLTGCNNGGILNGRAKICKRVSDTVVECWVPSTVTNGTTVGAWKVLDYGFDFLTRDTDVFGFQIYTTGATTELRAIFNITQAPGPGSLPISGNVFSGITSYASNSSKLDYVFELAKNIVPEVGYTSSNGNYLDDGGGISRPLIVANADVMTFEKCVVTEIGGTGLRALLQCESFQKQSRQIFFTNNSGALGAESMIQCDPVFGVSLDSGNWCCSIACVVKDAIVSACTSYAFYFGVSQGQEVVIENVQYEGTAGLLGFYTTSQGYAAQYTIRGGYHMINDSVVPTLPIFIQQPGGRLILENIDFQVPSALSNPLTLIELAPFGRMTLRTCRLPDETNLGGGAIMAWTPTQLNAGWQLITRTDCEVQTIAYPYRDRLPDLYNYIEVNPYEVNETYPDLSTMDTLVGGSTSGVNRFSKVTLPALNQGSFRFTLGPDDDTYSIAYPVETPEYRGDSWIVKLDLVSMTTNPDPLVMVPPKQIHTRWGIRLQWEGPPGGSETVTFQGQLERVSSAVRASDPAFMLRDPLATYAAGVNSRFASGALEMWSCHADANDRVYSYAVPHWIGAGAGYSPANAAVDAAYNDKYTIDYSAENKHIVSGGTFSYTGALNSLVVGEAEAAVAQHYFIQMRCNATGDYWGLFDDSGTLKAFSYVGGSLKVISAVYDSSVPSTFYVAWDGANSRLYANAATPIATGTLDNPLNMDSYNFGSYNGGAAFLKGKLALVGWGQGASTAAQSRSIVRASGAFYGMTIGA